MITAIIIAITLRKTLSVNPIAVKIESNDTLQKKGLLALKTPNRNKMSALSEHYIFSGLSFRRNPSIF